MSPVDLRNAKAMDSATAGNDVSRYLKICASNLEDSGNLHLVGTTINTRAMLRVLGSSESPATSAATGAIVAQKVPQTMPASMAKRHRTPKLLAKIQMRRQIVPQNVVVRVAMLILPRVSLEWPTRGLPTNRPRLRSAPTIEPC